MTESTPDTGDTSSSDSSTTTDSDAPQSRPVTVPNVSAGAKSGLDHQVIGSAAQEAYDATAEANADVGDTATGDGSGESTPDLTGDGSTEQLGSGSSDGGVPDASDPGQNTGDVQDANAGNPGPVESPSTEEQGASGSTGGDEAAGGSQPS